MRISQNSRSSGYGYGCLREPLDFRVVVTQAYITHRSFERLLNMLYPYPGYCGLGRTELAEVSGTGKNVVKNSQKFRVRV